MATVSLGQLQATGLLQQLDESERTQACELAAAGHLQTTDAGDLSLASLRDALAAAYDGLDGHRRAAARLHEGTGAGAPLDRALAPPAGGRPVSHHDVQPLRLRAATIGEVRSYVGDFNSRALPLGGGSLLLSSFDPNLRALDPRSGTVTATIPSEQGFTVAPIGLRDGGAAAISADGKAVLLDATGAVRGSWQAPDHVTVNALAELADGRLVAGSYVGRLFVLGPDGRQQRELQIDGQARDLQLHARADGGLVAVSPHDGLYLFDADLRQVAHVDIASFNRGLADWMVLMPGGGVAVALNEATLLLGPRHATLQLYAADGRRLDIPTLTVDTRVAPLLLPGGELAVATSDRRGSLTLLTATGAVSRRIELEGGGAHRPVAMPSGEILVGTDDGSLHLVDPATGNHRQARASEDAAAHYEVGSTGTIALLDGDELRFFDAELRAIGHAQVDDPCNFIPTPDGGFALGERGGYRLYDDRGRLRGTGELVRGYRASVRAVAPNGSLLVEQQSKLYAVKPSER